MPPAAHSLLADLPDASARPFTRFVKGLLLPLRAMAFLAGKPYLWPLVAVPALINLVLFVVAAVLVFRYADDLLGLLWTRPEGVLVALWSVAIVLMGLVGLLLAYVLVLLVGGIVASPFNDALSERTEHLLTGREPPQPAASFVAETVTSMLSTAGITGLYLVLLVPVLLLNIVPGIGSVAAAVVGALLGAFFVALEYADATFARYGLGWKQKVRLLRTNRSLALGMGLGTTALLWIPFLNFLCIPIAVVCGTALALRLVPPGRTTHP